MSLAKVALIRFVVGLCEPGGVTVPAPPARENINLAVDRDPWGRPHLPGTTLAGGLRHLVRQYAGDDMAGELFGRLTPKDADSGTVDAVASPIWVLASRLLGEDGKPVGDDDGRPARPEDDQVGAPTTVRTVTAIDRKRAAARTYTRHSEELLPAGTTFEAYLRWDDPGDAQLAEFLNQLRGWRPLIGRGVTRGRGRAAVTEVAWGMLHLTEPAGLAMWLCHDGIRLVRAVAITDVPETEDPSASPERLNITLRIDGPLRVGDGTATRDQPDGPEITRLFRDGDRIVLPGSGLKGLLRARCEYILRSVGVRPEPCLHQRCGACWPCQVFGYGGGDDPTTQAVGRRGRVRVLDATVVEPKEIKRTHVAIDRFTGGARDEHLFTVEAVEQGMLTVDVELLDLPPHRQRQLRALLRLVVADLADGLIGVGAGVTRGYGTVVPHLDDKTLLTVDEARTVLREMITEGVA